MMKSVLSSREKKVKNRFFRNKPQAVIVKISLRYLSCLGFFISISEISLSSIGYWDHLSHICNWVTKLSQILGIFFLLQYFSHVLESALLLKVIVNSVHLYFWDWIRRIKRDMYKNMCTKMYAYFCVHMCTYMHKDMYNHMS